MTRRHDGDRFEMDNGYSGKGTKTFEFQRYQEELVLQNNGGGKITFRIHTNENNYEVLSFFLLGFERFEERTSPFNKLEIIADANASWHFISTINIDG